MSARQRTRLWLGLPGVALAAAVVAMLVERPGEDWLVNATLAGVGLVLVWSVAVALHVRYPQRPLGLLLFALAGLLAAQTLLASRNPYLFTLARAARPAAEVLLIWVMLAFPSGRLGDRRARALVLAAIASIALLWLPAAMLSTQIPVAGPHVSCRLDCPRNVLFIADWPQTAQWLGGTFRAVGATILVTTALVLASRLRRASPLMRRALAPVLLASIARTLTLAALMVGSSHWLALSLSLWAVPLAIALGLLRGRLYAARTLQRLVSGLRARPEMAELRRVMADALGDDALQIAYWLEADQRWVDAEGRALDLPCAPAQHGLAVTVVRDAVAQPVAALVHDAALLEEPTLLESVAESMQVALESSRLEAEIRASSVRAASAVEHERHRIERDLHDGAQQRLIALRMKLGVTARLLDQDPPRAATLVAEMGADVEAALVELRALAHGIAPPLLVERGLGQALVDAAQRAPVPTRASIGSLGRCDPAIECAVYFCCLEALQNAAKHGGAAVTARLDAQRSEGALRFSVEDDGLPAAGAARATGGQGLINMRERIAAVGGELSVTVRPEGGFRVAGVVFLDPGRVVARRP